MRLFASVLARKKLWLEVSRDLGLGNTFRAYDVDVDEYNIMAVIEGSRQH